MKKLSIGALSALSLLAAMIVPTTASAESGTESTTKQAALRIAAKYDAAREAGTADAGDVGESEPTVSSAEARSKTDATGDVPNCGGDLTSFRVSYGTSTLDMSATTACSVNPNTSPNWVDAGETLIGWVFDHTDDGTADHVAVYVHHAGSLVAAVYRMSDDYATCETTGAWDGNRTYSASFAPSCFGSPARTYAGVLMQWDTSPAVADGCETCPFDVAPEDVLLGPIWRGMPPAPGTGGSGYWMVGQGGAVYAFGDARHYGNADVGQFGARATDIESRPNDNAGYWILDNKGHVFAFGQAPWHGNPVGLHAGEQTTSIAATKTGNGYYVFTDKGRAFKFGDAVHRGDMSGVPLNGPVLDSTLTGAGTGYYMVGSDGGIFSFNAKFYGSMGGQHLNQPVNGMAGDPDNAGYWLVASDGGIFAFNAPFKGSMGGNTLNKPVIGMVAYGNGYLMVGSDGGIFNFSSSAFRGSLGSNPPAIPITSVAPIR